MSPRHSPARFTSPDLAQLEADRTRYRNAGLAPLTLASYARDFRVFTAWCEAAGRSPLPASADSVELYVVDLLRRGRKITTLKRHIVGIQHFHRQAGHPSPCGPTVRGLLSGAQRVLCQQARQKEALTKAQLSRLVRALDPRTPIGARDVAIVLFGVASTLRRSNLAALQMDDLQFNRRGVLVRVLREKQDRRRIGRILAVCRGKHKTTCPVRALKRWLRFRGKHPGPVFCHVMRGHPIPKPLLGNRITQIVQQAVERIGLDGRKFGAHSLRATFVSIGLARGVNEIAVARQTAHRSLNTLALYARLRDPWIGNASAELGL